MDRNEYRDEDEGVSAPDTYWRRRVLTLALGMGLLGILAWGFSGGGAKSQSSTPGLLPATALGTAVPGLPSLAGATATAPGATASAGAASGGASTGAASPGAKALASGTLPSGGGASGGASGGGASGGASGGGQSGRQASGGVSSGRPAAHTGRGQSASAVPTPAANANPGGPCAPGAVVLSLFTDRSSYGPGEQPRFDVYAVSTTPGTCVFNPGQLQVVVLSSGRVVWTSSDCARDKDTRVQLARGVPVQAHVVWNREITLPGCQVLAASARSGQYEVQARTATVASPARYFRLAS